MTRVMADAMMLADLPDVGREEKEIIGEGAAQLPAGGSDWPALVNHSDAHVPR